MAIGDPTMHLACYCNQGWHSILPPPPCPFHPMRATISVPSCTCGTTWPTTPCPYHSRQMPVMTTTTTGKIEIEGGYTGKHRAPATA